MGYGAYKLRDALGSPIWPLLVVFLGLGTVLLQLSKLRALPDDNWRFRYVPALRRLRHADAIPVWARNVTFFALFGGAYAYMHYSGVA